MSFLARGLSNLIGLVVPIVHAFKVLKKPTNKRLTQSVHYWSVYGSFLIVDWFLTTFFISCFIPFYDFFVLIFTLLMAFPHVGFAGMMYRKFLAPLLRKYERRIDKLNSRITEKIWDTMPDMAAAIPCALQSFFSTILEPSVVTFEVEELESSVERRERLPTIYNMSIARNRRRNLDFEMQSDDNEENHDNDDNEENDENEENDDGFRPMPRRVNVKQEDVDEPRPVRRPLRARRAARSQSVM